MLSGPCQPPPLLASRVAAVSIPLRSTISAVKTVVLCWKTVTGDPGTRLALPVLSAPRLPPPPLASRVAAVSIPLRSTISAVKTVVLCWKTVTGDPGTRLALPMLSGPCQPPPPLTSRVAAVSIPLRSTISAVKTVVLCWKTVTGDPGTRLALPMLSGPCQPPPPLTSRVAAVSIPLRSTISAVKTVVLCWKTVTGDPGTRLALPMLSGPCQPPPPLTSRVAAVSIPSRSTISAMTTVVLCWKTMTGDPGTRLALPMLSGPCQPPPPLTSRVAAVSIPLRSTISAVKTVVLCWKTVTGDPGTRLALPMLSGPCQPPPPLTSRVAAVSIPLRSTISAVKTVVLCWKTVTGDPGTRLALPMLSGPCQPPPPLTSRVAAVSIPLRSTISAVKTVVLCWKTVTGDPGTRLALPMLSGPCQPPPPLTSRVAAVSIPLRSTISAVKTVVLCWKTVTGDPGTRLALPMLSGPCQPPPPLTSRVAAVSIPSRSTISAMTTVVLCWKTMTGDPGTRLALPMLSGPCQPPPPLTSRVAAVSIPLRSTISAVKTVVLCWKTVTGDPGTRLALPMLSGPCQPPPPLTSRVAAVSIPLRSTISAVKTVVLCWKTVTGDPGTRLALPMLSGPCQPPPPLTSRVAAVSIPLRSTISAVKTVVLCWKTVTGDPGTRLALPMLSGPCQPPPPLTSRVAAVSIPSRSTISAMTTVVLCWKTMTGDPGTRLALPMLSGPCQPPPPLTSRVAAVSIPLRSTISAVKTVVLCWKTVTGDPGTRLALPMLSGPCQPPPPLTSRVAAVSIPLRSTISAVKTVVLCWKTVTGDPGTRLALPMLSGPCQPPPPLTSRVAAVSIPSRSTISAMTTVVLCWKTMTGDPGTRLALPMLSGPCQPPPPLTSRVAAVSIPLRSTISAVKTVVLCWKTVTGDPGTRLALPMLSGPCQPPPPLTSRVAAVSIPSRSTISAMTTVVLCWKTMTGDPGTRLALPMLSGPCQPPPPLTSRVAAVSIPLRSTISAVKTVVLCWKTVTGDPGTRLALPMLSGPCQPPPPLTSRVAAVSIPSRSTISAICSVTVAHHPHLRRLHLVLSAWPASPGRDCLAVPAFPAARCPHRPRHGTWTGVPRAVMRLTAGCW